MPTRRSHKKTFLTWLAVLAAACAVSGPTPADAQQTNVVTIAGRVFNQSDWMNDPNLSPPQWHVYGEDGEPTPGKGRIMLSIYRGAPEDDALLTSVFLDPTDGFATTNLLIDASTSPSATNGYWKFTVTNAPAGAPYTLVAFIDGNNNRAYDPGEPMGRRTITPALDSIYNEVTVRDDTDGDGMPDWWEAHWFGDLSQTGTGDYDNDGLTNLDEYWLIHGIHPTITMTLADPDILSPADWDSDDDGMDDAWEVRHGLDPTSDAGDDGPDGDPDLDGLNNLFEYRGLDGVGPRMGIGGSSDGVAVITGSTDAMNPKSQDSDDDGVDDFSEAIIDLTNPVHSMSGTNFASRSLSMAVNGGAGVPLVAPVADPDLFKFLTGPGTVEFWIYPEAGATNGLIYYFPGVTGAADHFRIALDNLRPKMDILSGTNVVASVGGSGVAPLPTNQWSHVAFTWSPTDNSLNLYVDTVLLIAQKVFYKPNFRSGAPSILQGFSAGAIDELRVWDHARSASDLNHWFRRVYPAPGYVLTEHNTQAGRYLQHYQYPRPLRAYYRFDDGGVTVENFAFLNDFDYDLPGLAAAVTADVAAPIFDSDDGDGDRLPEWWVSLHNLEQYLDYDNSQFGPVSIRCPEDPELILDWHYFRSFSAYGSIGNYTTWVEDPESPSAVFHAPKTIPDFALGAHSAYMKYVYLLTQPREGRLELFTPGMVSTIVYINGERVTPEGQQGETTQSLDVASRLKIGRNMIYVRCESEVELRGAPSSYYGTVAEFRDFDPGLPAELLDCAENPYQFSHAVGKFDARLTVDGRQNIVRGDETRADPRAVWHCQIWSTGSEQFGGTFPRPDREMLAQPGNQEYGLPQHAERENNPLDPDLADDGLDTFYEFNCDTNPREKDSNNNGIPDGEEDFDSDGLINRIEQFYGSSPRLPDTDDDGLIDGLDLGTKGHPAQSLSPFKNRYLRFGGAETDYLELPKDARMALAKWTVEAWVKPDADETDGGVILRRQATSASANYMLGLGDGIGVPINVPYAGFVPNFGGAPVILEAPFAISTGEWSHVAATYYNGNLRLFVGGTNVAMTTAGAAPAAYGGGPIIQRVGEGFKGAIDELRIWSKDRSGAEILANRDEVLTGLENGLVAYYRFDDGTSYTNLGGGIVVGSSANNGTNGLATTPAWMWGEVEEYVAKFASDWNTQWSHAASLRGNAAFTTNAPFAIQGPPQLQVFIEPDDAVIEGAEWSYNGGATWNVSGFLETRLAAGSYSISFRPLDGWIAPAVQTVVLERDVLTTLTGRYIQAASLTVAINNNPDVIAAARWSIDGGLNWHTSGATVDNLIPGVQLDVIFQDISASVPGFTRPAPIQVTLAEGESRIVTAQYAPILGNVRIVIKPPEVLDSTLVEGEIAAWQISGNTNWQDSGVTVTNLSYGVHTAQYRPVEGWAAPVSEDISILSDELISLERTYTKLPEPTSLRVDIAPQDAIDAGAQWRVSGGVWRESGEILLLTPGVYTVDFRDIVGWYKPQSQSATVVVDRQTRLRVSYGRIDVFGAFGTAAGQFKSPRGLVVGNGVLYVTDSANHRVQQCALSTTNWSVISEPTNSTSAGSALGQFNQPYGIDLDRDDNLWIADSGNNRIQQRTPAPNWTAWGGQGTTLGKFNIPYDVAIDTNGLAYASDHHNSRVQRLDPTSSTWTDFIPNGPPEPAARFPIGIAFDTAQNMYVSDSDASLGVTRIRRFDATDGALLSDISTGDEATGEPDDPAGIACFVDDNTNTFLLAVSRESGRLDKCDITDPLYPAWTNIVPAGVFNRPHDVAIDTNGNVYVADTDNHRIVRLPGLFTNGVTLVRKAIHTAPAPALDLFLTVEQPIENKDWRVVRWQSMTERIYTLSVSTDLVSTTWSPIVGQTDLPGSGSEMRFTNTVPLESSEFYRLNVRDAD